MDPLVRSFLGIQRFLLRHIGSVVAALSLTFCLLLGRGEARSAAMVDYLLGGVALLTLLLSLAYARRRFLSFQNSGTWRHELALGMNAGLMISCVLLLVDMYQGTGRIGIYALFMLAGAFFAPRAVIGTWLFAVITDIVLSILWVPQSLVDCLRHGFWLAAFSGVNMVVFRAELARVRKISKGHVDGELERMRYRARSYRLTDATRNAIASTAVKSSRRTDEELMRSSVDELEYRIRFSMMMTRRAISLNSLALLWFNESRDKLEFREILSDRQSLELRAVDPKLGLFAAAIMVEISERAIECS